jgi:NAD(P)-dependent dehydrogenase (short-subunit alcohol dehydrogenase family)
MDGVAIVTGAAHGIGLAIAQRIGAAGARVVAVDIDADELASAPLPRDAVRLVKDLADDPVPWVTEIGRTVGTPTLLAANAAVMDGRGFLDLPMAAVEHSIRTNLLGTWALTRAVTVPMAEQGLTGAVVFTLSLHTQRVRMCPDYSTSKAGLLMLMKELAAELGPYGIRVNAVSPGVIDTWSDRIRDAQEHVEQSRALVPLRRLGEPEDVAKVTEFLLDADRSGYITGADIPVDGGLDQFNWLHHRYGSAAAEQARVGPDTPGAGQEPDTALP